MGWGRGGDLAEGTAGQSGWTADHHTCKCCRVSKLGLSKGAGQRLGCEGAHLLIYRALLSCRTWKPFQVVNEEHTIYFYL